LAFAATLASREQMKPMLLFVVPLSLHVTLAARGSDAGDTSLLFLYPFLLMGLSVFSAPMRAYRIGNQVFAGINNLIDDAVLLANQEGTLVFKNRHARVAPFLKRGVRDLTQPEDLIATSMTPTTRYGIPVLSSKDGQRHIECRTQPVGDHGKDLFVIFSDITRHIQMLDMQEAQRKELLEANQKLHHYSNIVFDLEKESEVAALLQTITDGQASFLEEFKARIEAISNTPDPNQFQHDLTHLTAECRENLARIRTLVAQYRRYHGT
ncbi:MAG: hypothetical protein MI799_08630, partial [Desulfobacterales bacterium]|nr:hypothetical protein [Desulfobacterales bacterium]